MGIEVTAVSGPFGAYVPAKQVGNLVFVAGQLPRQGGTIVAAGPVPSACPLDQARVGARQCVVNALAAVKSVVGSLDRVVGVVRVGAFVQSDPGFAEQPKVADGASEFLLEIFGEAGKHARAAVGVNALPANAAVEIEFIFELR